MDTYQPPRKIRDWNGRKEPSAAPGRTGTNELRMNVTCPIQQPGSWTATVVYGQYPTIMPVSAVISARRCLHGWNEYIRVYMTRSSVQTPRHRTGSRGMGARLPILIIMSFCHSSHVKTRRLRYGGAYATEDRFGRYPEDVAPEMAVDRRPSPSLPIGIAYTILSPHQGCLPRSSPKTFQSPARIDTTSPLLPSAR